ncbi:hypothetical protein HBH56_213730 [Parastagonospora nodorum]|uniref:Uncharacterized protein n=1 Tax=Phaeosphaeria nodorum (strain SN15 / ATCC MYA-4574 / FGSC 10173) TaxID=321614 RepID=A0A7U2F372_PHANO|nr:hypothetical protein HBH56_213730 [Parastagonospora nodorum]QRC97840.1 hypothetical protein JI435_411130 [Parastagonospora nodorum SN15]KAH3923096.1 hypothetical protein HBH54_215400 [Parastagonospora nodorum]KAH3941731.1 hypothetical protein HBH53_196690 [Parastagonospora nodorum]KAH4046698.1 hypothetical protein HBH49_179370 [Parastagonospora nodorum]
MYSIHKSTLPFLHPSQSPLQYAYRSKTSTKTKKRNEERKKRSRIKRPTKVVVGE